MVRSLCDVYSFKNSVRRMGLDVLSASSRRPIVACAVSDTMLLLLLL